MTDAASLSRFLALGSERLEWVAGSSVGGAPECLDRLLAARDFCSIDGALEKACGERALVAIARCCASHCDYRKRAYEHARRACDSPARLLFFASAYDSIHRRLHGSSGWNDMHKRFFAEWYGEKQPAELLRAATLCRSVRGWSHADLVRLSHAKPRDIVASAALAYIARGAKAFEAKLQESAQSDKRAPREFAEAYERIRRSRCALEACALIRSHGLSIEHVPKRLLCHADVWYCLVKNMDARELARRFRDAAASGVFEKHADASKHARAALLNETLIRKSKLMPFEALKSARVYARGSDNSAIWSAKREIRDALEACFKMSTLNAQPCGKRILVSIDVSPSMTWMQCVGLKPLSASEAAAGIAIVYSSVEPKCEIAAFSSSFGPTELSACEPFEKTVDDMYRGSFSKTDASAPILWALSNRKAFDAFVVVTDSWKTENRVPPNSALAAYRAAMDLRDAKLAIVNLSANRASRELGDGILEVAGFDDGAFHALREFFSGAF